MESTTSLFGNINSYITYHGSKSGIVGKVKPLSRDNCDFGRGFYLGDSMLQPASLIATYPGRHLYECVLSRTGLTFAHITHMTTWLLFVALNRGFIPPTYTSQVTNRLAYLQDADVLIGYIADDKMFAVLASFFKGDITDACLYHCLTCANLGNQYVLKTERACENLTMHELEVSPDYWSSAQQFTTSTRDKMSEYVKSIKQHYRREGKYYDELLEEVSDA